MLCNSKRLSMPAEASDTVSYPALFCTFTHCLSTRMSAPMCFMIWIAAIHTVSLWAQWTAVKQALSKSSMSSAARKVLGLGSHSDGILVLRERTSREMMGGSVIWVRFCKPWMKRSRFGVTVKSCSVWRARVAHNTLRKGV